MLRRDIDLGTRLVPYQEGWNLQRAVHAEVVAGAASTLLLLEHEPVYTVGRRTHSWERPDGDHVEPGHVPVMDVDRGGKTTWHGPGQLTVYPIIRLARPIDVIRYVRTLEAAVMEVCRTFGIITTRVEGRSGVWVPANGAQTPVNGAAARTESHQHRADGAHTSAGPTDGLPARPERKICALGVRVARGVTMHGIGFNVDPDMAAFDLDRIIPCGISDAGVTSLAIETGRPLTVRALADPLAEALTRHLTPLVVDVAPGTSGTLGPRSQTSSGGA